MLLVADYAVVSLYCLRVYLEKFYRVALDLPIEMLNILGKISCVEADLPDYSMFVKAFNRNKMAVWRVLLHRDAQLHEFFGHAAFNAMFFDRENASMQ